MLLALLDAGKRFFVARRFFFHGSNRILMHSASSYGYFTAEIDEQKCDYFHRKRIWSDLFLGSKIAFKGLTPSPNESTCLKKENPLKISHLQNKNIILVRKQHEYKVLVPIWYIVFFIECVTITSTTITGRTITG